MNHHFLIMWCNEGLEYVVDITADEQRRAWEQLKGELPSEGRIPSLGQLILRARYNSQRHYEIYTVEATEGITEQDIREMFTADPQSAANIIRQRGRCLHSDREDSSRTVIQ